MRPFVLATTSLLAGAAVAAVPSDLPTLLAEPDTVLTWWDTAGTADATVSVVQALAVAGFAYVAAIAAAIALADALRVRPLRRLALRLATPQLRRALTISVVAGAVALPSAATAEESMIAVTDLGPAESTVDQEVESFVLADLGPTEATPADAASLVSTAAVRDSFRPQTTSTVADAWLVESGDHLWGIAESVLTDRLDDAPSEAETARYWAALIDANASEVAEPDLIFPGQVLTLPPVATAGS